MATELTEVKLLPNCFKKPASPEDALESIIFWAEEAKREIKERIGEYERDNVADYTHICKLEQIQKEDCEEIDTLLEENDNLKRELNEYKDKDVSWGKYTKGLQQAIIDNGYIGYGYGFGSGLIVSGIIFLLFFYY